MLLFQLLNNMRRFSKFIFISILVLLLVIVSSCTKDKSPISATKEFYINDNANALLNATKWTIYVYGEELYYDSNDQEYEDEKISGSQVVVLTYEGKIEDINSTEVFNFWGIGKNDMGILIILFFEEVNNELIYKELVFEIGLKMSNYLSAFTADNLIDTYFNDPNIPVSDYDLRLISLYFGVLEYIYLNVYDYTKYNYDAFYNEYLTNQYEYFGRLPSEEFFVTLPTWAWVIIIILFIFGSWKWFIPLLFISFSKGKINTGGGGKSIGYWFRK